LLGGWGGFIRWIPFRPYMVRKKSKLYKLLKTGTEDMGVSGDQQYLGRVEDPRRICRSGLSQ